MSYTADLIRDSIRIVTPDSIRIRFERKWPIHRSLLYSQPNSLEVSGDDIASDGHVGVFSNKATVSELQQTTHRHSSEVKQTRHWYRTSHGVGLAAKELGTARV